MNKNGYNGNVRTIQSSQQAFRSSNNPQHIATRTNFKDDYGTNE